MLLCIQSLAAALVTDGRQRSGRWRLRCSAERLRGDEEDKEEEKRDLKVSGSF